MALAQRAGLDDLVAEHVRLSRPCGVNAQVKVPCLVAGMVAGADSIEDMDVLRHGALPGLQLGKVHRLFLAELADRVPLLPGSDVLAFVDIDSQQKRVYGTPSRARRSGLRKSRARPC